MSLLIIHKPRSYAHKGGLSLRYGESMTLTFDLLTSKLNYELHVIYVLSSRHVWAS